MIDLVEGLRPLLGGVIVESVAEGATPTEATAILVGDTGVRVRLSMSLHPESDLVNAMLVTPAEAEATAAASPVASPVATANSAPAMDEVLPAYQDASQALLERGREVVAALIERDDAALSAMMPTDVAASMGESPATSIMDELETDLVIMDFPEVGGAFRGHYTPERITGHYYQVGSAPFQLEPDEAQTGDVPAGMWSGHIGGPSGLGINIEFSGTAGALEASLSIPAQLLAGHQLQNVAFEARTPLGERTQERALPVGQGLYSAAYEWAGGELVLSAVIDPDGSVPALTPQFQMPLPPDPAAGREVTTTFRLPCEGTWLTLWGGETEFQNYHAPVPSQRHAYDLLVWKDGATFTGDGTTNDQYHAWGQPVLAPVDGTVITVLDGLQDVPPNAIADPARAAELDPTAHPAGNHVVIETAAGEYLLIGHLRNRTVQVAEGDTVATGDLLGQCGSSGNSSEPHIHIHLTDAPDMMQPGTIGLPLEFSGIVVDGEPVDAAPLVQGQLVAPDV